MKRRAWAAELLKRSYAHMREAEKESEGEQDGVVSKLREQYKIVRQEFDQEFGVAQ